MNHYFDIILLPDVEMPAPILMNAVCAKLHKQLCDMGSKTIGVSFPKYCVTLGDILRVHGSDNDLRQVHGNTWLGGMNGYCKLGDIMFVPSNTKFRTVSRQQPSMSQSKLKRLLKRGSISDQKIESYKNKMYSGRLVNPPYLDLVSTSNGQRHRRYIELGQLLDKPIAGQFDQFGLSKTATIPWF